MSQQKSINSFSIEHLYNLLTKQNEKTSEGYMRWNKEIKIKLEEIGFKDIGFRFRAHLFSFFCSRYCVDPLRKLGEKAMFLDYS